MRPKAWNSPQVPSGALSNTAGIRDGVPDLQLLWVSAAFILWQCRPWSCCDDFLSSCLMRLPICPEPLRRWPSGATAQTNNLESDETAAFSSHLCAAQAAFQARAFGHTACWRLAALPNVRHDSGAS